MSDSRTRHEKLTLVKRRRLTTICWSGLPRTRHFILDLEALEALLMLRADTGRHSDRIIKPGGAIKAAFAECRSGSRPDG